MPTPVEQWIEEAAQLTRPARVVWCDGSEEEAERILQQTLDEGHTLRLNEKTYPNCHLHRSDTNDVARTEKLTYICSRNESDSGPTNHWMAPAEAKRKIGALLRGAMAGRTMYVVPYMMGPPGSPLSQVGVELTDSAYVVAVMRIMTRMGRVATERLDSSGDFVRGLHSLGDLNPDRRFIMHFPEGRLIWSVGSGYGGNALLAKKCHALRLATWMAREQGWMADHMLILGLEDPSGQVTYMAAAFPSACGKTNLAMMVSSLADQGYRIWTVGDDIAWLRIGEDGRLRAINPEAGFFGVAPGTSPSTNPNVIAAFRQNAIFTNTALTSAREPWWEGMGTEHPAGLIDWQGRKWSPSLGPAAHPNSRYAVPARQAPGISAHWEDAEGVPISAFIFGGRRAKVAPLVYEALNWNHGVYIGATMASETTAATTGALGVTRRDPMAMLPFCGYHMGDYLRHWLELGRRIPRPPRIFHVNWFRKDAEGQYLWPGYGENVRVLKWILERVEGKGEAVETPIGLLPSTGALTLDGLNISQERLEELLRVDPFEWAEEHAQAGQFLDTLGSRLPPELRDEHTRLGERLGRAASARR
ncbi:MAG: phosphoenolpyruvate carboxykinase (GTP) [Candidatus Acidiferrales bacterium]